MDRFKAGNMTRAQFQTLEGFYSEFTENRERVVFVEEDIKELLGDQAMATTQEFEDAYAVAVRTPEQAMEVIREYDQNYAGNVEEEFMEGINSRHAVMPVLYDESGVLTETGVSLMGGDGVLTSDDSPPIDQLMDKEIEGAVGPDRLEMNTYPAQDSSEADCYIDVMLPPDYEHATHHTTNNSVIMEVDGEKQLEDIRPEQEVKGYKENNGVYTIEIGR